MKIISIVSANEGWFATFQAPNQNFIEKAIALWAIVEDDDGQRITSFSEDELNFTPDDEISNFYGWIKK